MKQKYWLAVPLVILTLVLSGCGKKDEPKAENKDYFTGMADINTQAQENIKKSTDAENKRLNETLKEGEENNKNNANNMEYVKNYTGAVLKTSMGDIKVKFNNDATPVTVNNFLKLSDEKFYDGVKFHRVIKGFMIQGGDPLSKDETMKDSWGTGGPGYKFNDELTGQEKYPQGTLAMANAGPNTNGSQFFIVTASPEAPLPPSYTVFGEVTSGLDIALKIENVKTTVGDRPVEDVVIKSVELLK